MYGYQLQVKCRNQYELLFKNTGCYLDFERLVQYGSDHIIRQNIGKQL